MQVDIFDLDGTLCEQRPSSAAPFSRTFLPGVREKLDELLAAGHVLAVASNQGGAKREKSPRLTIGAIMAQARWLRQQGFSAVKFSVYRRKKPAPDMLVELMSEFGVAADDVTFVGDAESDSEAAQAAGVRYVDALEFFR